MRPRIHHMAIAAALILALAGCATQTKYVAPQSAELIKIRRLAVHIKAFPTFVFIDRSNELNYGAAMLFGVWHTVYLQHKDEKVKREVSPDAGFDPHGTFEKALIGVLTDRGRFDRVDVYRGGIQDIPKSDYDAVAYCTIDRWGMRTRSDSRHCSMLVDSTIVVQRCNDKSVLVNDRVALSRVTQQRKEYFMAHQPEVQDTFHTLFTEAGARMGGLLTHP